MVLRSTESVHLPTNFTAGDPSFAARRVGRRVRGVGDFAPASCAARATSPPADAEPRRDIDYRGRNEAA